MKVRSALLTELSGKLGNAVASTARGGITYFRALVTPRNPQSFLQLAIRQALLTVTKAWQIVLSETQREAWWDLASGSQTGQTLFTRVNQPRIYAVNSLRITNVGVVPPDDALTYASDPPESLSTEFSSPTLVIDDSANTLNITGLNPLDPWMAAADTPETANLFVFATHQQSATRLARQHPYQLVRAFRFTQPLAAIAAPINLAAIGLTTEVGKVMYVKCVAQHPDGGTSLPIEQRITIVA